MIKSSSRFQTAYFWPSHCWAPENTDYAVYLCKRTMQNKEDIKHFRLYKTKPNCPFLQARLQLADYEAENLARLQKMFSRKWEFIFMQAEAQAKVTFSHLRYTALGSSFINSKLCQWIMFQREHENKDVGCRRDSAPGQI